MKKNLYFRDVVKRENALANWFFNLFMGFNSSVRLLIEVFTRKDFGERYFRLSAALSLSAILAALPFGIRMIKNHYATASAMARTDLFNEAATPQTNILPDQSLMPGYLGWYIFIALFLLVSVKHKRDMMHNPSVFDFSKYSLSSGKINPLFYKITLPGIQTNPRWVECVFEPGVFLVAGILLALIGQSLGWLLITCSVLYGMGYVATYRIGDNFVMDKIDQMIINENLEKAFVLDAPEDETKGFRFRGAKPETEDMRRQILPLMTQPDEEILEAK